MAGLAVLRSPLARSLCFRSVSRSLQWPRAYLTRELTPYVTSVNQGPFVTPERRQSGWSGRGFASGAAASERSSRDDGLQLTENAVRRLEELQSESPDKPLLLRLTVEGGGCSGFQYEFSLDSASRADDRHVGLCMRCLAWLTRHPIGLLAGFDSLYLGSKSMRAQSVYHSPNAQGVRVWWSQGRHR